MGNPLVSIIIPVYNIEIYLKECLDSILNQTYSNYEIILIDDGSTDSSFKICNEYANKDSRIKVYQQENKGCGIARNTGLKYAKGDYVTFIDGDDLIPKNYLEVLVNKSNGKDIVYVRFFYTWQKFKTKKKNKIIKHSKFFKHYFKDKYIVFAWGKLIPREYFNGVEFFPGFYEDLPVMYKALIKANRLIECRETFYIYRKRENSLTTTDDSYKFLSVIDNLEVMQKELSNYIKSKREMDYFDYYKQKMYLSFFKFSINSTNSEVLAYRKNAIKYLKKNTLRFLFKGRGLNLKCALILFSISPNLYFRVNNIRLWIKYYLFNKKDIVLVKKKKKK